jgi:hypothetical protein
LEENEHKKGMTICEGNIGINEERFENEWWQKCNDGGGEENMGKNKGKKKELLKKSVKSR